MDAREAILSRLILKNGDSTGVGCENYVVCETLSAIVETKQGGAPRTKTDTCRSCWQRSKIWQVGFESLRAHIKKGVFAGVRGAYLCCCLRDETRLSI